jgi:hypothetical protein
MRIRDPDSQSITNCGARSGFGYANYSNRLVGGPGCATNSVFFYAN